MCQAIHLLEVDDNAALSKRLHKVHNNFDVLPQNSSEQNTIPLTKGPHKLNQTELKRHTIPYPIVQTTFMHNIIQIDSMQIN